MFIKKSKIRSMKKLILAFTTLIAGISTAQVSFNNAPSIGTEIRTEYLDINKLNRASLKVNGADKAWDLKPGQMNQPSQDIILWEDPKTSFYATSFPKANLSSVTLPNLDSSVSYYIKEATGLYELGNADPATKIKWRNKLIVYPYPLSFNQNYFDTASANVIFDQIGIELNLQRNVIVDGWGTVHTPSGSYPCLRLINRTFAEGFIGPLPAINFTIESYQWLSPKFSMPCAVFEANDFDLFGTVSTDTVAYYINSHVTSNIAETDNIEIKILENPAHDEIKFSLGSDLRGDLLINLLSTDGKVVYSRNQQNNSNDMITISTRNFLPGTYLLVVQAPNHKWNIEKLVIQ